jgi:hypothetical protein
MTKKLILLSFIALAIILGGCSKESPVSPDLMGDETAESLAKKSCNVTVVNFTFDEGKPERADPGKQWTDKNGILHIRGQVGENAPIAGDFVGYDRHNVFNADINTATGNGTFHGKFTMEVEWPARNLKGIFRGHYRGIFTNWLLTGTTTALGKGEFDGMVLRIEQKGDAPGSYFLICTGTVTERK